MTAAVGRQDSLLQRILRHPETYFALFLQRFLSQETIHSVERIFSLMNAKWTTDRNRASVALIRSELHSYVLSESKLLNAAASGQPRGFHQRTD